MWEIKSLCLCLGILGALATDPCDLEFDAGPCKAIKNVIAFDKTSGKCIPKIWGGCRGNENRFTSIKECEETCSSKLKVKYSVPDPICKQEPLLSRKNCLGIFPRFTFNSDIGKCEEYNYGGCGGSENLFVTEDECIDRCLKSNDDATKRIAPEHWSKDGTKSAPTDTITFPEGDDSICSLPPIWPGPMGCMAFIKKWTYSKNDGACVQYTYGGCRGTPNLFDSQAQCESACKTKPNARSADVCSLPLSAGPCKAMKPSFGFNKDTGRCESFIYGGCKGNANNFRSIEECVDTCGGSEPAPAVGLTDCLHVECDKKEGQVQRAKGCIPVTKPGECCPSSWDCSMWERRLANKSMCFFSSVKNPVGKFYAPGERIPEVSEINNCRQACFCRTIESTGNAEIMCASVECGWDPGFSWKNCVPKYDNLYQCCKAGKACDDEMKKLSTCSLDGETYYEGQKMYPTKDRCSVCHCKPGWDGDINGKFCRKFECDLQLAEDKLIRGCQPVYQENVCCPIDWVCPSEEPSSSPRTKSAMKESDKCLLPKEIGPCKMLSPPSFYFDTTTRKCSSFNYGGCKGNENRFHSEESCQETCKEYMVTKERSNAVPDAEFAKKCEQEKAPGKCRGFEKKYFHDKNTKKCKEFIFTGCQGNENNYDSLDECEATCEVATEEGLKAGKDPKCNDPVMVGTCRSRLEKYYYDQNTGLCKTFYYSGCRGGQNMFDTLNECVRTCVQPEQLKRSSLPQDLYVSSPCEQEKVVGPCRAKKTRWYFNKNNQNCEQFVYSGCRGNDNNFETQSECQDKCRPSESSTQINISPFDVAFTTLPERVPDVPNVKPGGLLPPGCPGCPQTTNISPEIKLVAAHGTKKLAGYSQVTGEECEHVALREVLDVKTQVVAGVNYIFAMKLDIKSGPKCDVKNKRTCSNIFIHKPLSCKDVKTCLEIIREDDIICNDEDSILVPDLRIAHTDISGGDPCLMEKAEGRCRASLPRFYFHKATQSCKPFKYGGCMGNGNNFADKSSCEDVCSDHISKSARTPRLQGPRPTPKNQICKLAMDAGPCFALMPRFFFNFATRRCEKFVYGGCKGNANNFKTMQECISSCGKHPRSAPFPPLPPPLPKCKFGDKFYAIGDIIKLDGDNCKSCLCSSPPDLTCTVRKCTLQAFFPPRGGVNCVMQKDDFGCCNVGYKCDSIKPQAPSFGGSYPVLGGFGPEPLGKEAKLLAVKTTNHLLPTVSGVTGHKCSQHQLLDILDFQRQIVAGTNFRLTLRLRTKAGPDCSEEIERVCENIIVFRPLPHACLPTPENEECLTLTRPEEIICS